MRLGKQHLDLFAQLPRGPALSGFSDLARHIPCALVDGARHLPRRSTRTALELEGDAILPLTAIPGFIRQIPASLVLHGMR